MTDDLMLRFALERPDLVTEVGAKPSSGLTITAIKRTGAPGSTVKLGPPGGVMSAARAQAKSAFLAGFERAIAGEDECLARMMRAEGFDTTGMTGRLGQSLDPAPGIGLAAWEGQPLSARIADAVSGVDTSQAPDFIMGHYRIVPGEPLHEKAQREAKAWARRAERKAKRKRARAARKAGR